MNDLPLFLIAELLILIGVVNHLSLALLQVLAVMPLNLQVRTRFGINVCHVFGELRNNVRD